MVKYVKCWRPGAVSKGEEMFKLGAWNIRNKKQKKYKYNHLRPYDKK